MFTALIIIIVDHKPENLWFLTLQFLNVVENAYLLNWIYLHNSNALLITWIGLPIYIFYFILYSKPINRIYLEVWYGSKAVSKLKFIKISFVEKNKLKSWKSSKKTQSERSVNITPLRPLDISHTHFGPFWPMGERFRERPLPLSTDLQHKYEGVVQSERPCGSPRSAQATNWCFMSSSEASLQNRFNTLTR